MKPKKRLTQEMTVTQFDNGYWYVDAIKVFAQEIGVSGVSRLRKDELEALIRQFLETGKTGQLPRNPLSARGSGDAAQGLSLKLRVVNYRNDSQTKAFLLEQALAMDPQFKEKSGAKYRLNRWREEQLELGVPITYKDLVLHYIILCRVEGRFPQAPSGRYINFLSDFLSSEKNATRDQAIEAWHGLKELDIPKTFEAWKKQAPERAFVHHVMFDIDGTLVQSEAFDGECYLEAVLEVVGHRLDPDWTKYTHVSDTGILNQFLGEIGLQAERERVHAEVKAVFVAKIANHLKANAVQQVRGASEFIRALQRQGNIGLSIATGGWLETALMKLKSAEIDVSGIPIASSNDHFSRTEIMRIAEAKVVDGAGIPCTYFGDGEWDKKACEELGFNFVLVGEKVEHDQHLRDFMNNDQALAFLGL